MFAVGRLGSYISRGVNTVSGPFHPFGGAVDIVVVEQPDGSFKSSPWYIRFGKFQGVLKAREKVVNISVDGVEANFHMYLDHKGVAYFLREVDVEEVDFVLSPPSSGEEMDGQLSDRRPIKSMSCNYGPDPSSLVKQIDMSNGKAVVRTSSRRSRILGLVFGRNSMKEDRVRVEEDGVSVDRTDLLERAEIAADLLEVKWSTNLAPSGHMRDNSSRFSDILNGEANKDSQLRNELLAEGSGAVNELKAEESGQVDEGNELEVMGIGLVVEGSAPVVEEIAAEVVGQSGPVVQESVQMVERELVTGESLPITVGSTQVVWEIGPVVQDSRLVVEGSRPVMGVGKQVVGGSELVVDESEPALEESGPVVDGSELVVERGQVVDGRALVVEESELVVSMSGPVVEENDIISTNTNSVITESYSEMATVQTVDGLQKEVETCSVFTISSVNNTDCVVQDEKSSREEDILNKLQPSLEPVGGSQEINSDFVPFEAINNSSPEDPEEDEQFPFSDLEDFNPREVNHSSLTSNGFEAVNESFSSKLESDSSAEKFVLEKLSSDVEEVRKKSKIRSSHIDIPRNHKVAAQEVGCMVESLPITWSHFDELNADHHHRFIGHSLDSSTDPSKWMLVRKDVVSCIKSDGDEECTLYNSKPENEDAQILEELQNVPASNAIVAGDPSKIIDASSGSWRLWPFRRSRSVEVAQPAPICMSDLNAENALESSSSMDAEKSLESSSSMDTEKDIPNYGNALESTSGEEKCVPIPKANKTKIRALSPTSEQLASLNLKEGRNTITFTFSTSMLGKQQVDARIYLWRWDTRIVISDVDGTITKSDLLGQFMPLVGKDWSQTGVAHLFSAIKENGYQMLFLSARAISQAYHTRQFLFNLKQDGKALPDGPVVISPDGLFPSLFREVIRRAPHEFKISCLEDIRALFPSDRNPFYAGFGNRDTDEFSYLKVGIPKGKIFIINPKGEVVVNRRVDTKSYTSLQALVNGMFPPMSSHEQEDYNSWNFWKLPPPSMDM